MIASTFFESNAYFTLIRMLTAFQECFYVLLYMTVDVHFSLMKLNFVQFCACIYNNQHSTLRRGTLSPSGEIIARISLVIIGGAPGSADGAVPNSNLKTVVQNKSIGRAEAPLQSNPPPHPHCMSCFSALLNCYFVRPCNGIKALSQVRLDSLRIASLRENLQQLIIGEKIKARED